MYKTLGVVWLAVASALAVTQEELAQYVAQQQNAALGAGPAGPAGGQSRRQAYILPKSSYQSSPQQQVYQFQPKAAPQYQAAAPKYTESEQQYYQAAIQEPQAQTYYQPRPQAVAPQKKLISRPPLAEEKEEDYGPPQPYQFGFAIKDDEFTNYQNRQEQRDGDTISGSYSVVDSDGFIRTVKYTADPLGGFKADVVREPTDIKIKIPTPHLEPQQQLQYSSPRKQQTQQYLQAAQPKAQYAFRPEQTQALSAGAQRQYSQPQYQQQPQYQYQQ